MASAPARIHPDEKALQEFVERSSAEEPLWKGASMTYQEEDADPRAA
jgi:hypothetical protein